AFASILIDALVGSVPAGGVAKAAADAGFGIDAGDDLVVEVEAAPVGDAVEGASAEVFDRGETLALHPLGELVLHAFDDAEAVVHRCGADLHGSAAEQQELRGVAPVAH